MIFNSIRWRLQAWHGIILITLLVTFGLAAYHFSRENQMRRVDQELDQRLMALGRPPAPGQEPGQLRGQPPDMPPENLPEPPPGEPGISRRPGPAEILRHMRQTIEKGGSTPSFDTNVCYYVLWQRDGSMLAHSPDAPEDVPMPAGGPPPQPSSAVSTNGGRPILTPPLLPPFLPGRTRGGQRELFRFLPQGECVLVGRSLAPELAAMRRLAYWLAAAGAGVLALGLAGGWWLAARAIRPIENISATAVKIADGDLSQRISVADTQSELGRLTGVLNSTFARLEAAFAQQARFTADASHELRTPVSVILTQTQTALSRPRNESEYREALEACRRAAQRMRTLTSSLLELARLDAGQEPAKKEPYDLARVARDCVEMVRPLAAEKNVEISFACEPAQCVGDPDRLAQVITNLLTNAIHFNRPQGKVSISTRTEGKSVLLAVSDNGLGIPAEDLPHVFERFYRVDKSRSGAQGRSGLGLAICKAIVDAQAGCIEAKSQVGSGSEFRVRLTGSG